MKTIFIDESGNSGDAAIAGIQQQKYFALSAVNLDQETATAIADIVKFFRKNKNLQQSELKSTNTYDSQIQLTTEILKTLIQGDVPIWTELMDKQYHIACNLNTFTIIQNWSSKLTPEVRQFLISSADYLYDNFLIEEYDPFIQACKYPSLENVVRMYEYLRFRFSQFGESEYKASYLFLIDKYMEELSDPNNNWGPEKYLPIPDYLKNGKILTMLPYVPAFSNLLARVNKSLSSTNELGAKLIHDEQLQFDDIITDYKNFLENKMQSKWIEQATIINADFLLLRKHILEFQNSKSSLGLQIADIVAGFSARASNQILLNTINPNYKKLFSQIKHQINFVIPTRHSSILVSI
jgi:hypothetical protein